MMRISTLTAFDPAAWDATAASLGQSAAKLRATATELRTIATMLPTVWNSRATEGAVEQLKAVALATEGIADQQKWAAQILTTAARNVAARKAEVIAAMNVTVGQPVLVADDGTVTLSPAANTLPAIARTVYEGWARHMTLTLREILARADAEVTAKDAAMRALAAEAIPTPTSGPIDLDDASIRLTIDANQQDGYGDCVTLSMLSGKGRADPDWVRRHMVWDPATKRYKVTVYDPVTGKASTVSVDPTTLPARGAQAYGHGQPTWMSVMEEAYRQQNPSIIDGAGAAHPDVAKMVTGQTVTRDAGSFDDIRQTLKGPPPGNVVVGTSGRTEDQPADVDPTKRTVVTATGGTHAYSVRGFDSAGNIVLQNPWGPQGGYLGGKFYPGELHLTEAEFKKWFNTSTRVPGQ